MIPAQTATGSAKMVTKVMTATANANITANSSQKRAGQKCWVTETIMIPNIQHQIQTPPLKDILGGHPNLIHRIKSVAAQAAPSAIRKGRQ